MLDQAFRQGSSTFGHRHPLMNSVTTPNGVACFILFSSAQRSVLVMRGPHTPKGLFPSLLSPRCSYICHQ
uniref:Uncharacterized protein n=1 Tax=Arundo donax TaxID=35708 RepID=A0A0A9C026_ARUDO